MKALDAVVSVAWARNPDQKVNQDAVIELRDTKDALIMAREDMRQLMGWIQSWEVPFLEDDEWPEVEYRHDLALAAINKILPEEV